MRRVVILVENLPVPLDRRVWQEALALQRAGWDVTVICPRGARGMHLSHELIEGIEILRYPQRAASGLRGYLSEYLPSMLFSAVLLIRTRMRGPVHVIHGCNPPDLFWTLGWLGRAWGANYVFDQHDANPELSRTKFGDRGPRGRVLYGLTRWLEQRSYRTASLVIAPNDSYVVLAQDRGHVEAGRIEVVRNAPDVQAYRALAATELPRPHSVGYVGVMGSQDGLHLLLDAWRIVVNTAGLEDAELELVGDGEARAGLERRVERQGLTGSVTFHGYLRPDEFVPILARCAVCVSPDPPTPFNDVSTMVKVVDYVAIGRAIVCFDLRESALVAGSGAQIVHSATPEALASALTGLLVDPKAAKRLGAAAAARVAPLELDWRVSAARLVAAYDRLWPAAPTEASGAAGGSRGTRPTPR